MIFPMLIPTFSNASLACPAQCSTTWHPRPVNLEIWIRLNIDHLNHLLSPPGEKFVLISDHMITEILMILLYYYIQAYMVCGLWPGFMQIILWFYPRIFFVFVEQMFVLISCHDFIGFQCSNSLSTSAAILLMNIQNLWYIFLIDTVICFVIF